MGNLACLMIFSVFILGFTVTAVAQSDDTVAVMHTASGQITIEFFADDAPNHVDNFMKLAGDKFYDETIFHRVINGFMIQGGDPLTKPDKFRSVNQWGTGDPGYTIDAEFNDISHLRGIVSMARSGDPNSAGSQFFIVHENSVFLDGAYTVFGRIITQESFDTLDKIAALETSQDVPQDWAKAVIENIELVPRSQISNMLELDPPVRIEIAVPSTEPSLYKNERLGIEFMVPVGWIVQEPQKTNPQIPDVVAIKQTGAGLDPSISITVLDTEMSFDEYMSQRKMDLQPVVESGELEIISEEKTTLYGKQAYVIKAIGTFEPVSVKFSEVTFLEDDDKFYILRYTSLVDTHEAELENFENAVASFAGVTIDDSENSISTSDAPVSNNDAACLIATAAYGSELSTQVQLLREIRDNTLLQTESGSTFMNSFNQFYYLFSPTIADWERQNGVFKEAVKITITPLLGSLAILNHADINSESEMLAYGIGVIAMNIGMYFVAPAMIIHRIFRK